MAKKAGGKPTYEEYAKGRAKRSPLGKNCLCAFLTGGAICTLGQILKNGYLAAGMAEKAAGTLVSVTLVFLTALTTGLGWFDQLAKHAGAGTLVPITGFANAVVSPALDNKAEGLVLGLGAKIFTIAGPVILFGTLFSALYGVVYWMVTAL